MKLSVSKRNQLIQEIDLSKEVLVTDYSETIFLIGRSKECHIVLDDKQISREHSKFIHRNGRWFIELISEDSQDLLINGSSTKRAEVNENDSIVIGQFTINVDEISEYKTEIKKVEQAKVEEVKVEAPVVKKEATVSTIKAAPPIAQENITREIDVNDITREFDSTKVEVTNAQPEVHEEAPVDDFNFDDSPNETFAEVPEVGLESAGELIAEDPEVNNAYSLENIDSGDNEDSTRVMQSFASVHLELFGETAPYDKFILEKDKTFIGRDPAKCQIVLNDPEVSSVHAVIVKNNIMITLEDLNSANGTLLNGDRVNKSPLSHNDEFVIGGVTFTIKFRSEFLAEEHNRLMPVDEHQTVEVEEIVEIPVEEGETVNAFGEVEVEAPKEKSIIKRVWKDDNLRKKFLIAAVVGVGAWMMLPDEQPKAPPKKVVPAKDAKSSKVDDKNTDPKKVKLTEDQRKRFTEFYLLGKNHFDGGRYREALEEFDKINVVDPYFNANLPTLTAACKEGIRRLEEQERKRREEEALAERKIKIKKLLEEARKYTEEHNSDLANETFQKILTLDPENFEVQSLKRSLKSWEDEKKRKELEEAQKKAEREARVKKLTPGKNLYLQKDWYHAIAKLDEFLKISPMDEDLIKEASEMLKTSKEEISAAVNPLLGKAKSLQEGQDLKGAYEVYQQVLKYEPSNAEALNQSNEIKETLTVKARKIYREAIISESLSLFQDAKEKFQEVQQISPVDTEYYKKASDKLKDYLE